MSTFILGAGFSKPAGLPLGNELFAHILAAAKAREYDELLLNDISAFIKYKKRAQGVRISEEQINFEEFISYLDIEHYLKLEGSDHWSDEGNKSQMAIRNLIALVLHTHEQRITNEQFSLYENFVEKLEPNDWIITFNYDTILEKALEKKKIPFRLFPYRYKKEAIISTDPKDEVVVLKMHGSINWFDKTYFDQIARYFKSHYKEVISPPNIIFNHPEIFHLERLVDSPNYDDSPLSKIYVLKNLDDYFYQNSFLLQVPLIISPSYNKLVYLNPLREFWRGFNQMGSFEKRVTIIGFSLPNHDEYIRQPLYQLIRNFQYYKSIEKYNLKMIDYKKDEKSIKDYKKKYRFVNHKKTDYFFDGFCNESLDSIFENQKTWK